jgi:hypothetical protein
MIETSRRGQPPGHWMENRMLVKLTSKITPPLPDFQTLQNGGRIEIAAGTTCPHPQCGVRIHCWDARTIDGRLQIICANGHTFLSWEPRR